MTVQSLLVVLREKLERLEVEIESLSRRRDSSVEWVWSLNHERKRVISAIEVIEEVLSVTRDTRKEFGDPTLEAEADLGLGSSKPS